MEKNLKDQAARGILWKFLEQGGTQLIQFVSGIYIARILSPDDYGLIGMMAIFLAISRVFIDSGLKAILIQNGENTTQDEYTVVFYFNIFVSILFYLLIFFFAPNISSFYNEPRITIVARAIGLSLILEASSIVQQTLLEKKIKFNVIARLNLVSIILSSGIGIYLAEINGSYWALIAMVFTEKVFRLSLLIYTVRWKPSLSFNFEIFKSIFLKGSKLIISGSLNQASQNAFSLIVGRYFTTQDVGFFSQARKLQQRIGDFITLSIQGVMFPVQSLIIDDLPRLKNAIRANTKLTVLTAFPAIIGFMAIAKPFVLILLTSKWLPSVIYIHILSLAGIFFALRTAISSYLLPLGKLNLIVRLSIITNILLWIIIAAIVILKADLVYLIAGKALFEFILLILHVILAERIIKYRFLEFFKDSFPALVYSSATGILVYWIGIKLGTTFSVMIFQVITGILSYGLLIRIFDHTYFNELKFFIVKTYRKQFPKENIK